MAIGEFISKRKVMCKSCGDYQFYTYNGNIRICHNCGATMKRWNQNIIPNKRRC